MIITNKTQLVTALVENKAIDFGENGTLKTLGFFGQIRQWFYTKILPRAATELHKNQLQMAMARLISNEAILLHGPQNLEYPLPLASNNLAQAQDILSNCMIEDATVKALQNEPKEVQAGITKFLQAKIKKDKPNSAPIYSLISAYVKEEINALKEKPGELLGVLACGYTRTTPELTEQIAFLEESIQTAVQETWDDKHQHQFSLEGIYSVFLGDAKRDRPIVQGNRVDPSNTDADFAAKRYKEILLGELQEPSMVAVTGICMAQTVLVGVSRLVMGVDCPCNPLNPFITSNIEFSNYIITGVSSENNADPRVCMTHTEEEIMLEFKLGICLSNITEAPVVKQNVGSLSFTMVIPKNQFPLPLGSKPNLKITDMTVVRDNKGFTGG